MPTTITARTHKRTSTAIATATAWVLRVPIRSHLKTSVSVPLVANIREMNTVARRYSVAPMMDVTDRHFRALARIISRHTTLWTEMVVDRTLIHNVDARHRELRLPRGTVGGGVGTGTAPTVLQLGGSEPHELAAACELAADYEYAEVNLNCGCPSPRVAGRGCFGAALMREPESVAEMVRAMRSSLRSHVELSVKHRLGVDDDAEYEDTRRFVDVVSKAGCVQHFVVHARAALLNGINPKQNREIPPLRHDNVLRLAEEFPHLSFSINGGIKTVQHAVELLQNDRIDGVMVGRAVRDQPWQALADVDALIYNDSTNPITRRMVLEKYIDYAQAENEIDGCPVRILVKPILNLFHGAPRGKRFRREIDEMLKDGGHSVEDILLGAASVLRDDVLDDLPPSFKSNLSDSSRRRDSPSQARSGVLVG